MKKNILLFMTTATLIMTGCVDKNKIITNGQDGTNSGIYGNGTEVYGNNGTTDSYGYGGANNVDPYGSGNYGNYNSNGAVYGDGTYGSTNGSYAGSGVESIYFDVNQYNITADKIPIIHSNANALRSKVNRGTKLKIEGHCDASGSDEYNYALGLRRAKAAKDALIDKGLKAENMLMISMGESSPECIDDSSPSCYAKNRRVEFKLAQ
jgi:peptidoglycan-associated lipoprotein